VALWDLEGPRVLALSQRAAALLGVEASAEAVDFFGLLADPEPARQALEGLRSGQFDAYQAHRRLSADGEPRDLIGCVRVLDRERTLALSIFLEPERGPSVELADVDAAVGTVDGEGRIRHISADVTPLLGYLPPSCIGLALESLVHPDDHPALLNVLSRVATEDANISVDIRVRTSDGSWRPVHLTLGPATDGTTNFGFAAVPTAAVTVAPGGSTADRIATLEQHLARIAREVEAAGVVGRGSRIPDPDVIPALGDLTSRQWQILTRLLQGERVATIAREMFLSPSTVRNHLSVIYKKLGVHSQTELIEKFQSPG
jgi:PAS domain S-box-containing protein